MSVPFPRPKPMRTQEELTPIALHVATNSELMVRFRDVIGSEDMERASKLIDEVTNCAKNLDATITASEGTRIVVLLMKLVSHPNERIG